MNRNRTIRTFLLGTTLALGASAGLAPLAAHAAPVDSPTKVNVKNSPVVEAGGKVKIDPAGPVIDINGTHVSICVRFPDLCPVKPPKSADPGQPTGTTPPKPTGTTPPKPTDTTPPKHEAPATNPDAPVRATVTFTG